MAAREAELLPVPYFHVVFTLPSAIGDNRVAISNSRLIAFDRNGVTFKYKDYRADGSARSKRMTLTPHEFPSR